MIQLDLPFKYVCCIRHLWRRLVFLVLFLSMLGVESGFADGSKDLYRPGTAGRRAYLLSRVSSVGSDDVSWPFRTFGEHYVYVSSGETLAIASSAHGYGSIRGKFRLTSPSGDLQEIDYNGSNGRIANRAQELAGPLPPTGEPQGSGANRYSAYYRKISVGESGIWKVEFFPAVEYGTAVDAYAPGTWADSDGNQDDWSQATSGYLGQFVSAWDVSVWGNDDTWKPGRVYTTVMNFSIFNDFSAGGGFYGKFYPLTKDGWVYEVDNNGQNGIFFTFFVNNKGFYRSTTDHMPSYKSVDFSDERLLPLVKDPRSFDNGTDITCKMFYTYPDRTMPAEANIYADGKRRTTWLISNPTPPEIHNLVLTGVEGTEGHASQKGGYIRFDASVAGIVKINFDLAGYVSRTITEIAVRGANAIFWDGKDGAGNYLPEGVIPADVSVQLFGAEVHFPYIDKEINPNGIKIQRLDDVNPSSDVVYWDDSNVTGGKTGTRSNPAVNLTGISSSINGHKWGTNETNSGTLPSGQDRYRYNEKDANYSFGNGRAMDTWAYIPSSMVTKSVNLEVLKVDLGVEQLTHDLPSIDDPVRPGDTWNYTVEVFNASGYSNATGALFDLYLPVGINVDMIDVVAMAVKGGATEVLDSRSFDPNNGRFRTLVNLPSGAKMKFTIPVKVSQQAIPGTPVDVWATILRPADVYDHDATNLTPDDDGEVIRPTDPFFECQGIDQASGPFNRYTGDRDHIPCNNLAVDVGPSVAAFPFVNLTKVVSTSTPITKVGDVINYVFEVSNPGNVDLTNVNLSDALPGISAIAGPTYVTGNSDATLNPGEVWQYAATYTIQPPDVTEGSVANSAAVSAIPTTGGSVTGAASVLTTIYSADLHVSKSVSNASPRVGGTVTFEIEVTNDGPSNATNVRVTDAVPNGYSGIAAISGGGSLSGNTINWELSIVNGETQTVTYDATVLAPDDGISHVNQATVADADLYDPDIHNNTAEASTQPRKSLLIGNPIIRSRLKKGSD